MGSGASTAKDALKPLLMSPELFDGSFRLAEDSVFRSAFTDYIKSGAWLDRLIQLTPNLLSAASGTTRRQNEHLPVARLQEYNLEPDKLTAIEANCKSDKISPSTMGSSFGIPMATTLSTSSKSSANDGHSDLYSGETGSFAQEELLVILFAIVYPIYLVSSDYERFVIYGFERGGGSHDDHSGRSTFQQESRMVQTDRSKRAQEVLLGCAAYYDESSLQEYLREPYWLDRVCPIFHDHPVPLCFTDTAKAGLPIVFVNKAFCRMFGFSETELVGSHISILYGSDTEVAQQSLMLSKIRSAETVKFSITLQSKARKPMFDLVAQKAIGAFSISAHFVKSKHLGIEVLNMVDDVLTLLSYLVKAPALPTRPSWLPTPIVILAQAASHALHVSSPSSARSQSSLSSRSKHNSSGHGGHRRNSRNSKGTPTSVRSFAQPSSGGNSNSNSNSGSAQSSFRSFRKGAGQRRQSGNGGTGTPTSYHSAAGNGGAGGASGAWTVASGLSAGQHVATDAEAAVECSVGETTNESSACGHK